MTKGFTWKPHLLKIIISVSAKWRPCWTSKFAELTFFYVSFPPKPYSTLINFNYCFEFTMTVNRIQIPFSFFRSTPAWKEAWTWCCQAASGNTPHHRPLFHLLPGPSTPAQGADGADDCIPDIFDNFGTHEIIRKWEALRDGARGGWCGGWCGGGERGSAASAILVTCHGCRLWNRSCS